jgi:hypothetical protein
MFLVFHIFFVPLQFHIVQQKIAGYFGIISIYIVFTHLLSIKNQIVITMNASMYSEQRSLNSVGVPEGGWTGYPRTALRLFGVINIERRTYLYKNLYVTKFRHCSQAHMIGLRETRHATSLQ